MATNNHAKISLMFLFLVTFICQMTAGAVQITVPIYAETIKISTFMIGIIGSAGGLFYSFLPFLAGTLCDKTKRKIFIFTSLFLYSIACIFYSFSEEAAMLILSSVLAWSSGAILWPTIEALLADLGGRNLEETVRKFSLSWGSAIIIGPLVGGFLITSWSIKAPFTFALSLSATLSVLSIFILKEPVEIQNPKIKTEPKKDLKHSIISGLASIFLLSSIEGIIMTLFPAYATRLGISAFNISLIVFSQGAGRIIIFSQANKIEAKIGKMGMLLSGSFLFGVASILTVISNSIPFYMFCFVLYGFGTGLAYTASLSLVLRRWETTRGQAAGIFESLLGFGYFAGPLIGGAISTFSEVAPYYYGFALSIIVFTIQIFFRPKNH